MSGLKRGHEFMVIAGEWKTRDDGVTRPIVRIKVWGNAGEPIAADFLIDSGADRSALSAALLTRLGLPSVDNQPDFTLTALAERANLSWSRPCWSFFAMTADQPVFVASSQRSPIQRQQT